MSLKRKLEVDEGVFPAAKQLKFIPFPNMDLDTDVAMLDAEPLLPDVVHSRLSSNASSLASYNSDSPSSDSPAYPTFDTSSSFFFSNEPSVNPYAVDFSPSPPIHEIGLLQPKSSFVHHSGDCTQIPKLRVACASGVNGQRSMWTHCEQCGAISIVESD